MTEARKDAPTLVDVEQLVTRLETLKQQESALAIRETTIATEITDAHINGLDQEKLSHLTYNRREAREDREDVAQAIPALQDKIKQVREAACLGEASKRMRGIGKAFGSLLTEIEEDEVRVQVKARVYSEAVSRLNDRYKALKVLKAEASALSDRFAVKPPTFLPVALPALREGCKQAASIVQTPFLDHHHISPKTEKCADGLRERRTYGEVNNTPTALIIESAGPKPWPPLTAKQTEIVGAREREKVTEAAAFARAGGALEAAASPVRHGL